jgi:hypothetical protein
MNKKCLSVIVVVAIATACLAQTANQRLSFDQLFPQAQQRAMGLHKLSAREKEALRAHVEGLLAKVAASTKGAPVVLKGGGGNVYAGVGGGHWIKKNVDRGTYIILEDGSLWQIDPVDKVYAMLWLPISNITVTKSSSGSPGFDYLLINTDDGEKAHAKYMGKE